MNALRVYAPSKLLFVCGGEIDLTSSTPKSMRDVFLRFCHDQFGKTHTILRAEEKEITSLVLQLKPPSDILTFEAELAQISEIVVLFSESYGSAAELGAFCVDAHISSRLLVFIDNVNYEKSSFIKLGPLKVLMDRHGDQAVSVLNRDDIRLPKLEDVSTLDQKEFRLRVASAISSRVKSIAHSDSARERTTFNPDREGHRIKLIVGMIQHYGALTLDEISTFLDHMKIKITDDTIRRFLLCAEFAEWIIKDKRGTETYYSAIVENQALHYEFLPERAAMNRDRWRAQIAEYWRDTDHDRFSCITAAIRKSRTR